MSAAERGADTIVGVEGREPRSRWRVSWRSRTLRQRGAMDTCLSLRQSTTVSAEGWLSWGQEWRTLATGTCLHPKGTSCIANSLAMEVGLAWGDCEARWADNWGCVHCGGAAHEPHLGRS